MTLNYLPSWDSLEGVFGFYLLRLSNFIQVSILRLSNCIQVSIVLGSSAPEEAKPALKSGQPESSTFVLS